jgi:hypothetical protein
MEKPEGERPLGRSRLRWEDNNKIGDRKRGWSSIDSIHQAQGRDQWRALVHDN